MKKIGVKSLLNVLYATIILLPMFSIFGRLIYTQANPNAKDSFSNYTQTISTQITLLDQFELGSDYVVNYLPKNNNQSNRFYYNHISFNVNDYTLDSRTYVAFAFINNNGMRFYDSDSDTTDVNNVWGISLKSFSFNFDGVSNQPNWNITSNYVVYNRLLINGKLDNAFEYSIKTFTDDNNFGNVDFFGWFTNLFLNQSSTKNALYLNFVNWYLNYTLLVSSGYLLFLALIWFINYVRKILDKSMYHDFGGY